VKADANPGVDNVAFFKPQQLGTFDVRCNELCGIWHGAMFNYGSVVSPAAFQTWALATLAREQRTGVLAILPPFANTYDPTVIPQLGKAMVKIVGITGAPGYYYSPANPVQP
jgi:cytochrome c oxidase subunit II